MMNHCPINTRPVQRRRGCFGRGIHAYPTADGGSVHVFEPDRDSVDEARARVGRPGFGGDASVHHAMALVVAGIPGFARQGGSSTRRLADPGSDRTS